MDAGESSNANNGAGMFSVCQLLINYWFSSDQQPGNWIIQMSYLFDKKLQFIKKQYELIQWSQVISYYKSYTTDKFKF